MLTAERQTAAPLDTGPRPVIATSCLSGTLEDKLRAAAAAGFTGVEICEDDLIMSPWSPHRVRDECAALGLRIDVYQPFRDFEAVPPDMFAANLRRAARKFDLMEQLGAATLLVCSAESSDVVDDDSLAAEQLGELASDAERRGLRIAYEAQAWGRHVTTTAHAWRIVRAADHPALGLCLDSFHELAGNEEVGGLSDIPGSKIFHVQLADAARPGMDAAQWSRHHRLFPGQGAFDLSGFLEQVLATGYAGPLSLEVSNDVYRQGDPRYTAIDAMRALLALESPPLLPPAPRLGGQAFTELAVDEISGPELGHALATLGFVHVGQHRSKPVQLWQQGSARILLNFAPDRALHPATASICALAVNSADPQLSARRAERLLAPALPRTRRADEADLCSVGAPDGTAVFFCRNDWLDDFLPTGASSPDGPVSTTDHVSFTESVDDFDHAVLFYRCVLGMQSDQISELPAPFGLIHRRTATDPDHQVRINLNTAPLRRGDWGPAVPSPQHVAFSTDDAVGAARAMRERGAQLLTIPDNYYDDLDARLGLPSGLLASMREHSILYDRDEHGEYLHFSTEIVGGHLFFEVVQRIGSYEGYGGSNSAAVCMAAHRRSRRVTLPTSQNYSLAHLTALSLSPPELVEAAAEAGYRYVGLRMTRVTPQEPHYPLATDPALMRATKSRLAATGVDVLDVELARIGPDGNPRDYLRFLEAGAELGARHVITQLPDGDFARKSDRFAELCDLARPLGLTIDLEFPSWTETPNLAEATRVLRTAARPNAGILVDLLHFARSNSSVDELRDLPPEWFHFAHVCDAPAEIPPTEEGLIHTARFERLFPGEGGIGVHTILSVLPPGIPYALEIPHAERVAQFGAKEHARLAITAARKHLDPAQPHIDAA
ncbi:4-hydroxyphenylpyruvate dioxygenase-like putative hemolysin [Kribbella sp. VKM Ac-2569]|uniref:TIM barrel protein n=1 Tax=Kribbella sp. VKM Ac-2569 TaxID=2512220 RepID=UPI00102B9AB6|nr:TIM barrel protein [Kribbella sp. VKM Ac-2569]RZT07587.1 4-hydroxyphenylpyruvate dioxygenase-like putative hemolysin [Kribbella sp. VKM Ac-2569]